ncbi:unnamed protein product [Cylindrotheca closterium]|uniref:Uncharacterized protein n=1 Tax=Cylindrotheca closterium TaxID=2856 RepID=A0AAD2CII8_9STRA|nr:unnamed protein product [Cylindrotheca closterium]
MGKMKNLQMLENCFANSENVRDAAKMEAMSSKLIRQNSRLQKEKEQLARQARKQELCIGHLLKKLENAADLANDQQVNFDEAHHRQTETVASMLQELSKSRKEIIQLRNELELERIKNRATTSTKEQMTEIHRIPSDCEDFSDEATVLRNNVAVPQKDVAALEDEVAYLRHSLIQQESQYKESLKDNAVGSAGLRRFTSTCGEEDAAEARMHHDRFRPDDDIEIIHQPFAHDTREKRIPRSGLQEIDAEAPRPPLSRQSSGVRGSSQSPPKLSATSSNSRSFAMDAVRLSRSSRTLGRL